MRTPHYRLRSGEDLVRVLRDARTARWLTQQQLVDRFELGFDRTRLARIEAGEGFRSLDRALAVLRRLGIVIVERYDRRRKHEDVTRHDFVAEAHRWGLAPAGADRLIDDLATRLAVAAAECSDDRVASLVAQRLHTLEH